VSAAASAGTARLERDGVTRTGYLILGTWGWFLYGFGALLPQLGADQGISRTQTALHSVALSIGALIAGYFAVPMVRRWRRRGTLLRGNAFMIAGCLLLAAGGHVTGITLVAALIIGTGGSTLVNTINTALLAHHQRHAAAAIAEGNAMASLFGLVAPLAVGAGLSLGLTWRPSVLITVPLACACLALISRHSGHAAALDEQLPPATRDRRPLPAAFWPAAAVVVFCVAVEFCMGAWSAQLLHDQTGLSRSLAAAGVSAVVGGMAVGRLAIGRLALVRSPRELLFGAIVLTVAGWAIVWTATVPWLAVLGLLVTGCGMGAHYPVGAAITLELVPAQRDHAAGVISIGVGVAAGGGPFVIGALADATSIHTAFLVVPLFLALAAAMLAISSWMAPRPG
jgi:MFS family permease